MFDETGNLTGSWGESGSLSHQLNGPCDLQIGPEGDLYVADYYNYSVKRFTLDGQLVRKIDLRQHGGKNDSRGDRRSGPRRLSVRDDGMIAVTAIRDQGRERIWMFDKFGNKFGQESIIWKFQSKRLWRLGHFQFEW